MLDALEGVTRSKNGDARRAEALRALATQRGFYIPSFYDVAYDDEGRIRKYVPKPGTGAAPIVRKAAVRTTEALDPPSTCAIRS